MNISIKCPIMGGSKIQNIYLEKGMESTVGDLKKTIIKEIKYASNDIVLFTESNKPLLGDGDEPLSDYEIEENCILKYIFSGKGGGCEGFSFPDMEKMVEIPFSKTAPKFRLLHPGINIEAICHKCKNYVLVPI